MELLSLEGHDKSLCKVNWEWKAIELILFQGHADVPYNITREWKHRERERTDIASNLLNPKCNNRNDG